MTDYKFHEGQLAEQALIGSVLIEGALFHGLQVTKEHIFNPRHKRIFTAMKEVAEKEREIDLVTVTSELGDDIHDIGGVAYLSELAGAVPTTSTVKHYENIVLEVYRDRKTRAEALRYAENPSQEALYKLIQELEALQDLGVLEQEKTTADYLRDIAELMSMTPEEAKELNKGGYKTGFVDFDEMTGGLQRGDLIIVAARPSVGKTAFALNIASGHCNKGGSSHVFSLEMSALKLLQRMISAEGNVDGQKWRTVTFSEDDYTKAIKAIGILSNWNLNIYEKATTLNEIKANIRKAVNDTPNERHLVVIDYLQLIVPSARQERRDLEVGAMTRELKLLATELDIPIVLLSQLSRGVEQRQDKRPMLSDLRESGNIEQDADLVGFLYRDDYYNKESELQNIIEIILAKQRNGPVGTVELAFIKEYGKFVNLSRRYQEG